MLKNYRIHNLPEKQACYECYKYHHNNILIHHLRWIFLPVVAWDFPVHRLFTVHGFRGWLKIRR